MARLPSPPKGCVEFGIDSFREFPGKCRELADQLTAGLTASQGADTDLGRW